MGLHKIIKIVALLLAVVSIVFFVMILNLGDTIETSFAAGDDVTSVTWAINIAYIMLGLVLLLVLVFVVKGIFAGDIKKTLMSVGIFLVIGVVSYVLASDSLQGLPLNDGKMISPSGSKWVGAGIISFYILALLAIAAMVFSGIKNLTSR